MRILRSLTFFSFVICICAVALSGILRSQSRNSRAQDEININAFPITDSVKGLPADPNLRAKRQKKNREFNNNAAPPVTERSEVIFAITEWQFGLPALPVAKSAAVVIGEIKTAEAYLSEDRSSVYSEFELHIDEVLKNDQLCPLVPGGVVMVSRQGGRVRFPSGKILISLVDQQDMPKVGGHYVMFLIHRSASETDSFDILTGYELRGERVLPLDKVSQKHPIRKYEGVAVSSFFADVRTAALAKP